MTEQSNLRHGLNGALAVERLELTKMIPPNVLARAGRVIK